MILIRNKTTNQGIIMTSPTLEQQIEFIELLIPTYEATHGVIDNDKAILASLKRLQAIDAQEAVGVYTGEGLSSVAWRDDVTVGELMGKKLYARAALNQSAKAAINENLHNDGMCESSENPDRRCVCREEFGHKVCGNTSKEKKWN